MNTQITRADGYVYCGRWDHKAATAVQRAGEIVVTEYNYSSPSERESFLDAYNLAVAHIGNSARFVKYF